MPGEAAGVVVGVGHARVMPHGQGGEPGFTRLRVGEWDCSSGGQGKGGQGAWGREGGPPLPHPTPRPGRDVGVGMLTGEVLAESFITLARSPTARPNEGLPAHQFWSQNNDILFIP